MNDMLSTLELLESDSSGQGLKQLRDELFEMRSCVTKAMDAGMGADEIGAARQLLASVETAEEVVDRLYKNYNA